MTVQTRTQSEQAGARETATVSVPLGDRSYRIEVGRGLLARAGDFFAPVLRQKRVFIVTDSNVAPLYLAALEGALQASGIRTDHVILPAGEASKRCVSTG